MVAEIIAAGRRTVAAKADVGDMAAVEEMVGRTERKLGPVTILVNNAGVSWRGTLDTYDPEQVARMRRVNVEGVTNVTRAVMGGMRERRYGRIVNVSSIAAIGTAMYLLTWKICIAAATPANSATTFARSTKNPVIITKKVDRNPNSSRMRSESPFPVTTAMRAHISSVT